jgi:hypothetical protein
MIPADPNTYHFTCSAEDQRKIHRRTPWKTLVGKCTVGDTSAGGSRSAEDLGKICGRPTRKTPVGKHTWELTSSHGSSLATSHSQCPQTTTSNIKLGHRRRSTEDTVEIIWCHRLNFQLWSLCYALALGGVGLPCGWPHGATTKENVRLATAGPPSSKSEFCLRRGRSAEDHRESQEFIGATRVG